MLEQKMLKVFNVITTINEAETFIKPISCNCKCKFNRTTCKSNQKRDNGKCQCECKKYRVWKKSL